MTPADLAAIRALIESDEARHRWEHVDRRQDYACVDCSRCTAAREALGRVESLQAHYDAAMFNWDEVIRERDYLKTRLARGERSTDCEAAYEGMVTKFAAEQKEQIGLWARIARLEGAVNAATSDLTIAMGAIEPIPTRSPIIQGDAAGTSKEERDE